MPHSRQRAMHQEQQLVKQQQQQLQMLQGVLMQLPPQQQQAILQMPLQQQVCCMCVSSALALPTAGPSALESIVSGCRALFDSRPCTSN